MKIFIGILALIYLLSPYDLLPDFLVGWGWLDDGAIVYLLWRYYVGPAIRRKQTETPYEKTRQHFQNNRGTGFDESVATPDPYTVLGVKRNASRDEIKRAYKQLALKYHPDKAQHLGKEFQKLAEARFKDIQDAYTALSPKK
ncbi:MAG: DnaJ domain-containing protein [Desulfobacterales bacterium]